MKETRQLHLTVALVEKEVAVAVQAFYQVMSYVTSFFGSDRSVFNELDAEAKKVLPRFFA